MTKNARRLQDAFSQLAIEYLQKGDIELASRVTTVAKTLTADPKLLDRLARILAKS